MLDRLVGYKISPLLWEKIRRGLSAGRVQSVAVRLICEREQEIRAFVPQEYWSLHAAPPPPCPRVRGDAPGEGREKLVPSTEAETRAIVAELERAPFVVKAVDQGERREPVAALHHVDPPAGRGRKLRFSASKTMMVAQQLYEGVEIDNGGPVGLITYMRTDSPRVAAEATAARDAIAARYGPTRSRAATVLPGPEVGPGSPRGDPADAARPPAGAPGPSPEPRPARALPADLGAVPGEPDAPALYDT